MKEQLIQSIKNSQVPISENEQQVEQLVQQNAFEPFKPDFVSIESHPHRWSSQYFAKKLIDLEKYNFSKELASHLIEVKKHLQAKGMFPTEPIPLQTDTTTRSTIETEQTFEKEKSETKNPKPRFGKIDLTDFKPNIRLISFLSNGDVNNIRTELMSLLNNRRLGIEEVAKSIWYVWQTKPEIFAEEEKSVFVKGIDKNEANWDSDYFCLQQVYLNRNFTLERLLHLVNVRETLMHRGDKYFQQIHIKKVDMDERASTQPTKKQDHSEHSGISKLLLVGGAVLALFAALFAIF
ncbi:hypothetical protein ACNO7O_03240 [Bisgaard Taxon 45]